MAVVRNPSLRRVLLAFIGFSMAEWATWIAILVYAFSRGGATETGIAAVVQLVPSAVVAPLAASLGDHVPRDRALRFAYVVQGLTMSLTATALLLSATAPVIYLAAATATASITLTRPIQSAILPSLSRAPAELTAANVVSGTVQNGSILVGPILAGITLALLGPAAVFIGSAAVLLFGALLVAGVHPIAPLRRVATPSPAGWRGMASESLAGFGLLLAEDRPRTALGLLGAAAVLWGALDVLLVVLALDLLGIGEAGVGYLNAAIGAGGLVGAAISVLLIGRSRLAGPLAAGIVVWSLPIALLGVIPGTLGALALIALAGTGHVVMDVAGRTLLQRVAPDGTLTRVFGVLEGLQMASLAVGSLLGAALVGVAGPQGAFLVGGGSVILILALTLRPLRRLDSVGLVNARELALLRSVPIFEPLGAPELEQLAARLVPVHAHADSVIIRQGERGDHYYIVASGRVRVEVNGRPVREQGAGEGFGEIALLRNVPRTATVRALESTELLSLDRTAFVEAVTGQPASHTAAEATMRDRLLPPEGADASA